MSVSIHAIATAVPEEVYEQSFIRDLMKEQPQFDRRAQRLVSSIYNASGIDRRYSVVADMRAQPGDPPSAFFNPDTRELLTPSTGTRNTVYARAARDLFTVAARRALEAAPDFKAAEVTHVITVSCTGFFAPGPDYHVVRDLDLAPSVQRYHLGFMGCYAAFPALRAAKAFCEADPSAVVLVICAELCSLHVQLDTDPDTLIANSVFADGAAAALVSARPPRPGAAALRMDSFETTLTPTGEADMAWTVGDQGFKMVLSTYVPHIIEEHIHGALAPLWAGEAALADALHSDVQHWAIHPGGRSILDKVQGSLSLSDAQLRPSREVLREYGNMSSATVLFILQRVAQQPPEAEGERVCALAFGPGLTVDMGLFTKLPPLA